MLFRAPIFWLIGYLWFFCSALLGLVMLVGMTAGWSLPAGLRLVHVHGALAGGVAQIILGAILAFISPLLLSRGARRDSHQLLFTAVNGGTLGLVVGFGLRDYHLVAVAGGIVLLVFVSVFGNLLQQSRRSVISPPLNIWYYSVVLATLFFGLGFGEAVAFRWLPGVVTTQGRLAHIHLTLLGFVTLTIVGTMHQLFPAAVNHALHSRRLARLTVWVIPIGIGGLLLAVLSSSRPLEIVSGVVLLTGVSAYGLNMWRTWIAAGRPRTAASDHLLLGTLFLWLAVLTGILVAINALWQPPAVPFGTLHLVAYTHLALVGFIANTIMGVLSQLLPWMIAVIRVKSNKKRGPYLAQLTQTIEQGRAVQVGALSLGVMGIALVAALVWQFPLMSFPVQAVTWISAGLVLVGLGLFTVRLIRLFSLMPED
jgi:hypothetical protein